MNYSGTTEYVRMLRAWEKQGLFNKSRNAPQPQPQRRRTQPPSAPTTFASLFIDKGQKDRGATSPLDGRVKQGW